MDITNILLESIKGTNDIGEFHWNAFCKVEEITKAYKSILEANIGDFVRIKSDTFGNKTGLEYNLEIPPMVTIIKKNKKTVNILDHRNREFKFPITAIVSDDISWIKQYDENYLVEFYNNNCQ